MKNKGYSDACKNLGNDWCKDDSHYNIQFLVSLLFLPDHNSHSNQQNNTVNLKHKRLTAIIHHCELRECN